MEKRYQVFISSTYFDLKEERRSVTQTVIELDGIPAGMELFPATDEEQLAFVKRVIDDCDYYLLIIGGRYGSVTADGVSYTEKEFDYAVSRDIPIIALVHENPGEIPFDKSEKDPVLRERLQKFREKVCTGRVIKHWKHAHELPGFVAQGLSSAIHKFPTVGWVRGNRAASEDILSEINDLRKKNADLTSAIQSIKPTPAVLNLASLDEQFTVHGTYRFGHGNSAWSIKVSWREIFAYIAPYLVEFPADNRVELVLRDALWRKHQLGYGLDPALDEQDFKTISIQLKAIGLIKIDYGKTIGGGMALFWSATPAGDRLTLELRTVRSQIPNQSA